MCNRSNVLISMFFIFQILAFVIYGQDGSAIQDESIAVDDASVDEPVAGTGNTDCTGSDYNLGRIIGTGPLFNLLTSYWPEDGFMLLDMLHAQGGVDNKYNIGWSAVGTVFGEKSYDPYWVLMFPELSFNSALGNANRLRMVFTPANFVFVASNGNTSSGFDSPFYMHNSYQWDFLSNDGEIKISPDQYDNAFYFRPLVNQGQVRISTALNHSIRGSGSSQPSLFDVRLHSSVGLIDNMQADIGAQYQMTERANPDGYFYYIDDYSDIDTLKIETSLHYRIGELLFSGAYNFQRDWYWEYPCNRHLITTNIACLLGDRVTSIKEVEGNWDGYFKPLLGKRQLYISACPEWNIDKRYPERTFFRINNDIRFGVLKSLTLGENFYFSKPRDNDPKFHLELNATFMNIPHRSYGPSEASKFEYVFGLWPKKGQVRIDLAYNIPFENNDVDYYQQSSILNRITSEKNRVEEYSPSSSFDMFIPSIVVPMNDSTGIIYNHDFLFRISAGLHYNVFLSNTFEFKIDNVKNTVDYVYYENSGYYRDVYGNNDTKNLLYSDNVTLAFGNPGTNLFLLAFTCFGQTDKRLNGRDKFDFLVSAVYERAF
ncbi:MAG TPA: hypothetical protein VHO70_02070 [Chitinispirillaceae bacterium]|nr:hypothetical protein [Chitinispirillaceae bacterium]